MLGTMVPDSFKSSGGSIFSYNVVRIGSRGTILVLTRRKPLGVILSMTIHLIQRGHIKPPHLTQTLSLKERFIFRG